MKLRLIIAVIATCAFVNGCVRVDTPKKIDVNINADGMGKAMNGMSSAGRSESGGSWSDKLSQAGSAISDSVSSDFYTDDVLTRPGKKIKLVSHCDPEEQPKDGFGVTFYRNGKILGRAVSDKKGVASIKWRPPEETGVYIIKAELYFGENGRGEKIYRYSKLIVSVQTEDTPMIIVDLDKTLVKSSFFRVVMDSAKPMPYAAEAMEKIAQKYSVVYLTHRFSGMTTMSKSWLERYGFPAGPLLTNKSGQLSSGDYKYGRLRNLKKKFKNIRIGVGDKDSDIESYRMVGMKAYWIVKCKDKAKSLRKLARKISKFDDDDGVQVVVSWKEVENGILFGEDYSAAKRVKAFRKRAKYLKKLEDDDDDDDD